MQHAVSYQSLHDWDYERASLRADAVERRYLELQADPDAVAAAWISVLEDETTLADRLSGIDPHRLLHAIGRGESDRIARQEVQAILCNLIVDALTDRAEAEVGS